MTAHGRAARRQAQAALLVRRGLADDRAPAVAKAAGALLAAWYADLAAARAAAPGGPGAGATPDQASPDTPVAAQCAPAEAAAAAPGPAPELAPALALVAALGPEAHEAEAEAALRALAAGGVLSPARLAAAVGAGGGLRRGAGAPLLSGEEALLWRVLAQWLQARCPARPRAAAELASCEAAARPRPCSPAPLFPRNCLRHTRGAAPACLSCTRARTPRAVGRNGWQALPQCPPRSARACARAAGAPSAMISPRPLQPGRAWQEAGAAAGRAAAGAAGAAAAVAAAEAGRAHAALDALLPDSVADLVALVGAHAAAGPAGRFAALQLLRLAAGCADLADASGRRAAAELLQARGARRPRLRVPVLPLCGGQRCRWSESCTGTVQAARDVGRRGARP